MAVSAQIRQLGGQKRDSSRREVVLGRIWENIILGNFASTLTLPTPIQHPFLSAGFSRDLTCFILKFAVFCVLGCCIQDLLVLGIENSLVKIKGPQWRLKTASFTRVYPFFGPIRGVLG